MNSSLIYNITENYKPHILEDQDKNNSEISLKIQRNIKLLKEIIDQIDYFNYFNEKLYFNDSINFIKVRGKRFNVIDVNRPYIKGNKLQKLRMKQTIDLTNFSAVLCNYIYDLFDSNEDIKEIIDELDLIDGKINNTKLFDKILLEIQNYTETLYQTNYGVNSYYNKNDNEDELVGILHFDDSGKFDPSMDNYKDLDLMILYCYNKIKNKKENTIEIKTESNNKLKKICNSYIQFHITFFTMLLVLNLYNIVMWLGLSYFILFMALFIILVIELPTLAYQKESKI